MKNSTKNALIAVCGCVVGIYIGVTTTLCVTLGAIIKGTSDALNEKREYRRVSYTKYRENEESE